MKELEDFSIKTTFCQYLLSINKKGRLYNLSWYFDRELAIFRTI